MITSPFSIAIAGGGSTYTTGIVKALLTRIADFPVTKIALYDTNGERQNKVAALVKLILRDAGSDIEVIDSTDPKAAFTGTHFVFAQIRSGGMTMREMDEKIPLKYGCVGQETCGAMVEVPVYLGSNGPEVTRLGADIPDFQKGLMENQAAAEKLLVDAFFEKSYRKALQAFTLNRTIPSAIVARKVLNALIEANKDFWPELKK